MAMRILLASSELFPYSKSGGLADMVAALAKSLAQAGHRVGVVTPLYRGIGNRFPALRRLNWQMELPLGHEQVQARVWTVEAASHMTIYFVDVPAFYDRAALYTEGTSDYPDNAQRFVFFAKAVVHLARYLPWRPEVVHVHDWQVGIVPLMIRHAGEAQGWINAPTTCLTIHNLAYQGVFPRSDYAWTNLPEHYFNWDAVEFHGHLNCLKAGLVFADTLTTVSPRYAREIRTEELGCGLEGVLRQRARDLTGILNGVDYHTWNTTDNPHLSHPYSCDRLEGKAGEKAALQRAFGLLVQANTPLFGSIMRLTKQKGVEILLPALEEMLAAGMQFVMLGNGAEFEGACRSLAARHSSRVGVHIGFDEATAHRIEAGCDFFVMPSQFEPSGLNQMYSLRYGTIPIVRKTGGLDDSVVDIREDQERPTGIKFGAFSPGALAKAMRKALELYRVPELLRHYQQTGMRLDFSWERTATQYANIYHSALARGKRPTAVARLHQLRTVD